jgi:hypothetical protein
MALAAAPTGFAAPAGMDLSCQTPALRLTFDSRQPALAAFSVDSLQHGEFRKPADRVCGIACALQFWKFDPDVTHATLLGHVTVAGDIALPAFDQRQLKFPAGDNYFSLSEVS